MFYTSCVLVKHGLRGGKDMYEHVNTVCVIGCREGMLLCFGSGTPKKTALLDGPSLPHYNMSAGFLNQVIKTATTCSRWYLYTYTVPLL